ncbi:unnamed protein product [Lampetra planeri]
MGGPNGTPIFRAPTTAAPATEPLGRMTLASRLAFAGGHFFNDVCAATWFTYGLAFLHGVAGIGSPGAGLLVLLGQVADGLATPLVGIAADRAPAIPGMARRKSWHLLGAKYWTGRTVLLTLTFPFTFASCLACGLAPQEGTLLGYYAPFIVLSQVAWAAVQVSHLALIPELAHTQSEKVELTAYSSLQGPADVKIPAPQTGDLSNLGSLIPPDPFGDPGSFRPPTPGAGHERRVSRGHAPGPRGLRLRSAAGFRHSLTGARTLHRLPRSLPPSSSSPGEVAEAVTRA